MERIPLANVPLTCVCGGQHGDHYELRNGIPSRLVGAGCNHCQGCRGVLWMVASLSPEPEPVFSGYRELLTKQAAQLPQHWTFKSNPIFQQFLEHVTQAQGEAYLSILRSLPEWSELLKECVITATIDNDTIGLPVCSESSLGFHCSPTNLRYAWQALTLWRHIKQLKLPSTLDSPLHIVEIGGGYGGLALFVHRLTKFFGNGIFTYTIVDVAEAGLIQTQYAYEFGIRVHAVNGASHIALQEVLNQTLTGQRMLVSSYGFSELSKDIRDWYEQELTGFCQHGFLVWNRIGVYPLTDAPQITYDDPVYSENDTKVVLY